MATRSKIVELLVDELEETGTMTEEEVKATAESIADRLVEYTDVEDDRALIVPDNDREMDIDGATD